MSAREEILRRVRAAHVTAPGQGIRREYSHVRTHDDRLAQFVQRVEDYKATVIRTRPDDVAAAVATCLTDVRTVVVPPGFDPSWVPDDLSIVRDEPALGADEEVVQVHRGDLMVQRLGQGSPDAGFGRRVAERLDDGRRGSLTATGAHPLIQVRGRPAFTEALSLASASGTSPTT